MAVFHGIIPLFRIFDVEKAKSFYMDYLGFKLDWDQGPSEGLPTYMQISLENCTIHLTEHYGDCTPGAALRIEVEGIERLHAELLGKNYLFSRPGIEVTPWDSREVTVIDPFGNRITFYENDSIG